MALLLVLNRSGILTLFIYWTKTCYKQAIKELEQKMYTLVFCCTWSKSAITTVEKIYIDIALMPLLFTFQTAFTCSKLKIETLEQRVKYVQS